MNATIKPRGLWVDDEPSVLRSLNWLLRSRFDVSSATDASEGLELIRNSDFDVVISDQRMPGMLGTEFLQQVKEMSPHTMRLLLTGYADYSDVLRSVNDSEVFRFINKPWNNQHLVETVSYAANVAKDVPLQRPEVCSAGAADALQADLTEVHGSSTEAVFLMDNDPVMERQLREALGEDMLMLWARSPGEAVSLLHRYKVAVIVADNPSGSSATLDLIRAVKRSSPGIVAVICSSQCDSATISRLINEGQIFRFVAKPAGSAYLRRTLRTALKKHRELMSKPACIARHAVEISRLAAQARTRNDPMEGLETDAMLLVEHDDVAAMEVRGQSRTSLSGMLWLRKGR
jgi:DNA-binding NtrC family response regulator